MQLLIWQVSCNADDHKLHRQQMPQQWSKCSSWNFLSCFCLWCQMGENLLSEELDEWKWSQLNSQSKNCCSFKENGALTGLQVMKQNSSLQEQVPGSGTILTWQQRGCKAVCCWSIPFCFACFTLVSHFCCLIKLNCCWQCLKCLHQWNRWFGPFHDKNKLHWTCGSWVMIILLSWLETHMNVVSSISAPCTSL